MENITNEIVCSACGTVLRNNETFCPNCGAKVERAEEPVRETPAVAAAEEIAEEAGATELLTAEAPAAPAAPAAAYAAAPAAAYAAAPAAAYAAAPAAAYAAAPVQRVCSTCGSPLEPGEAFCPRCGQRAVQPAPAAVNPAFAQYNAQAPAAKKTNLAPLFIALGAVAVAAVVIISLLLSNKKPDFNKMYSDIANKSWCTIASDGTWMKIDTNPYDLDDEMELDAYYKLEDINSDLGFSSAVYEEMGETRSIDGRQTATSDKYEVSWTYHPDRGLEAMYKLK